MGFNLAFKMLITKKRLEQQISVILHTFRITYNLGVKF